MFLMHFSKQQTHFSELGAFDHVFIADLSTISQTFENGTLCIP